MWERGIISGILLWIASRHYEKVDKAFPQRKKRLWRPLETALQGAAAKEEFKEVFDAGFFNTIHDRARELERDAEKCILFYIMLSVFAFYLLIEQPLQIRMLGIALGSTDGSLLVATASASFLLIRAANKISQATAFSWILDAAPNLIFGKRDGLYDQFDLARKIYAAQYSGGLFEDIAGKHTIKVKYLVSPGRVLRLRTTLEEFIYLLLFLGVIAYAVFLTGTLVPHEGVHTVVKSVVIASTWVSLVYFALSMLAIFSVVTAVLAKGRLDPAPQETGTSDDPEQAP